MRPFMIVLGLLSASQSATDLIALVLNNSKRHKRWSTPSGFCLQIGQGILSVGYIQSPYPERIRF